MTGLLSAIQFDPEIRGILVVLVGTVVLAGSVYLIISTNVGARLGLLITACGLFGWLTILGIMWWMYGIGLIGRNPAWMTAEINFNRETPVATEVVANLPASESLPDADEVLSRYPSMEAVAKAQEGEDWAPRSLTSLVTIATPNVVLRPGDVTPELREALQTNAASVLADNPDLAELIESGSDAAVARRMRDDALALRSEIEDQLGGWCLLAESDPRRGEAVAASDAAVAEQGVFGDQTSTADYIVKDVFIKGGKEPCEPITERGTISQAWHRIYTTFQVKNPKLYSVVTLVRVKEVTAAPGEAPPSPSAQPGASTVSTIMLRNLGNKRMIPAVFTIFSFIMFAVFAAQLHHRDKLVRQHQEDAKKA